MGAEGRRYIRYEGFFYFTIFEGCQCLIHQILRMGWKIRIQDMEFLGCHLGCCGRLAVRLQLPVNSEEVLSMLSR